MKRVLWGLVIFLVAITAFVYGVISSRYGFPPFRTSRCLSGRKEDRKSKLPRALRPPPGVRGREDSAGRKNDGFQESLSKIVTLPYLGGYNPAPPQVNITRYDAQSSCSGLNFYTSGHAPQAILMDMRGSVLHSWGIVFKDVWPEPGPVCFLDVEVHKNFWRQAQLFNNGDVLAIFDWIGLIKLDKDSKLLWSYKGGCHHDLFVADNGNIYVLTQRTLTSHEKLKLTGPIMEDFITVLTPQGEEIKSVSLIECFLNSDYDLLLTSTRLRADGLHTNTIELLDGKMVDQAPMFERGHILVSVRNLNTIAVVDFEEEKVTWALSGMWKQQHKPTLLENGNLLLFDNLGHKGRSRVIEFNPLTQEIVWAYQGDHPDDFFSRFSGSNQRLPNGNTLITESDNGRAFEVTPGNKIVWEFKNPHRVGSGDKLIGVIFEMVRIAPEKLSFLRD